MAYEDANSGWVVKTLSEPFIRLLYGSQVELVAVDVMAALLAKHKLLRKVAFAISCYSCLKHSAAEDKEGGS